MGNMKDDLERLAQVWDKALAQGIFNDAPNRSQPKGSAEVDFFGQMPTVYNTDIRDSDMEQWNNVLGAQSISEESLLTEEKAPSKGAVRKHTKKLANTNNPVYPNTKGPDSKSPDPEGNFAGGKNLEKLIDLKKKLHQLKAELTKSETLEMMGGKGEAKVAKLEKSIDSLSDEIDELSDSLNGSIIDNK